jgi:hypothetical protein
MRTVVKAVSRVIGIGHRVRSGTRLKPRHQGLSPRGGPQGSNEKSGGVQDMVVKIRDTLDLSGDGTIRRDEAMQAMGSLPIKDMLK